MNPGKHWVFLTQCDNQFPISLEKLESLLKIHACFHERVVISDTPSLSNWKLYDIASRDKLWINSGLLIIALRDGFSNLVELHKHSLETGLSGLDPNPGIATFFNAAQTVPINFSHLSRHYSKRVQDLLNDSKLIMDFGIQESLCDNLYTVLGEERAKKGFVTRSQIFEFAKSLPEHDAARIRKAGSAYYWEGVPAVLGTTASIHRSDTIYHTDILDEAFDNAPVSTVSFESKEEIEILDNCRSLRVQDILTIRKLQTFDDLNCAIRDCPDKPEEQHITEIQTKYMEHLYKIRGMLHMKSHLIFKRMPINSWIDVHPRLPYYGIASWLLQILPHQNYLSLGLENMLGALFCGMALLYPPEQMLEKTSKRKLLPEKPDEIENQFRVKSIVGNIGRRRKRSEEE